MKKLSHSQNQSALSCDNTVTSAPIKIKDASFPSPFPSGLEYGAPARGTWNIVHVGMLIPEAHQIFVCAQGCLRGVVLTVAEMGASHRFSTVAVRENNVLEGNLEELVIDGVSDILEKLPEMPPAVLVYTSCVHHFMGCDLGFVYDTLRKRFPGVRFADCYMNPIMRKSGMTPDQLMRNRLYSLLDNCPKQERSVTIAGNDFSYDPSSELVSLLTQNGITVRQITECKSFDEYLSLAASTHCITTFPAAKASGERLENDFGQKHLYLPQSFDYDEISRVLTSLCDEFDIKKPDFSELSERCDKALEKALAVIGNAPVTIDYTAFPRPLGLAQLLAKHGFNVTAVYADAFTAEEKEAFDYLRENAPEIDLYPTVHPCMRVARQAETDGKTVLAIGQKAAYFCGTDRFVNVVEGGGMYGFDGILKLSELMIEAYLSPKDTKSLIQIKGMGCDCCH